MSRKRMSRKRSSSRRRSTRLDEYPSGCKLSLPSDVQKAIQEVVQSVVSYHAKPIQELQQSWNSLSSSVGKSTTGSGGKKWKAFIRELPNKYGFYEFRKELAAFLTSLCEPIGIVTKPLCKRKNSLRVGITSCQSFGSKEDTSDIDVTISGDCMYANLIVLKSIQAILRELFHHDTVFHDEHGFSLKRVFELFDVNFYLSNFAILRDIDLPKDLLSSYYITTDGPSQYRHAFSEDEETSCNYDQTILDIEAVLTRLDLTAATDSSDASHESDSVQLTNRLVDLLSTLTKAEDEGYRTQGAFFHVVLMLQRKMVFKDLSPAHDLLFYSSLIENLRFALSHPSSRVKYLTRAADAIRRITTPGVKDMVPNIHQTDAEIRQTLLSLKRALIR